MRIAVLGPGALGCLLAARLAEAGEETVLLDHDAARAAALAEAGLHLETDSGTRRVDLPVFARPADVTGVDLLVVLVKAYDTEAAVRQWRGVVGVGGRILTLQNGLGNAETILDLSRGNGSGPTAEVVAGVTAEGATLRGPGHTAHVGSGGPTVLVALRGGRRAAEETAEPLRRAGLEVRIEDDAGPVLWSKFLVNVGANAVAGVLDLGNGELAARSEVRPVMAELIGEAVRVAERTGVGLPPDAAAEAVERTQEILRRTAGNVSSLLADLRRGRRTEIEVLNGHVVREGEAAGVATPVNRALWAMVRALESRSLDG